MISSRDELLPPSRISTRFFVEVRNGGYSCGYQKHSFCVMMDIRGPFSRPSCAPIFSDTKQKQPKTKRSVDSWNILPGIVWKQSRVGDAEINAEAQWEPGIQKQQ